MPILIHRQTSTSAVESDSLTNNFAEQWFDQAYNKKDFVFNKGYLPKTITFGPNDTYCVICENGPYMNVGFEKDFAQLAQVLKVGYAKAAMSMVKVNMIPPMMSTADSRPRSERGSWPSTSRHVAHLCIDDRRWYLHW